MKSDILSVFPILRIWRYLVNFITYVTLWCSMSAECLCEDSFVFKNNNVNGIVARFLLQKWIYIKIIRPVFFVKIKYLNPWRRIPRSLVICSMCTTDDKRVKGNNGEMLSHHISYSKLGYMTLLAIFEFSGNL